MLMMRRVTKALYSKHFSILIGLMLFIISVILWRIEYTNSLEDLSKHVDSVSDVYANQVEQRLDTIEFSLAELASHGSPSTLSENVAWTNRSLFYVQNLAGVDTIIWVDNDLIIQNVSTSETTDFQVGDIFGSSDDSSGDTNIIYPMYDGDTIDGFTIANIDLPEIILTSNLDVEQDYMIQVFDDTELLGSTDNWEATNNYTVEKDIGFKSIEYRFELTPTNKMVSSSVLNSYIVFIFGAGVSIIIALVWYTVTDRNNRLEELVTEKTSELSDMVQVLQDEKDLAQSYLSIAGVMIVILDKNGTIQLMNRKGCDIIGENEDHIIGQNWFDEYIPPESRLQMRHVFAKVFNREVEIDTEYENYVITKNGEKRLISWNNSVLYDEDNNPIGVLSSGEDITELKHKEEELSYLSYRDQLTGLYNRRFFEEQLNRLNNPRNLPLSIIMGDVNGLKLINDAFGHKAGDNLLQLIGKVINKSIRGNDIAARWGGDEFTILLPNTSSENAKLLIQRIKKAMDEASFEYGKVSISFGIDSKQNKETELNEVFVSAEQLMYQNKLAEIDSIRGETINTIMNTLFEKSAEVKDHCVRVSELSVAIAKSMGLSQASINDIKTMGMLHDIGKIVIDLHILDKPGKLTQEEREIVEQHPLTGSRMLNASHEYTRLAVGVLHHHERVDGSGYPNGIIGDQIPIESKIIAVADAFDAMTAVRPYRLNPLSQESAVEELIKHSGRQFDEAVVNIFVEHVIS